MCLMIAHTKIEISQFGLGTIASSSFEESARKPAFFMKPVHFRDTDDAPIAA